MTDRQKRLEGHVKALQEMRNVMCENENWENLKRFIEAVTTGGMAIQRIIKEDFEEPKGWIPVSERMPEVMDGTDFSADVLLCVKIREDLIICTGFYGYYPKNEDMKGWWSVWADGCEQIESGFEVLAWQPLPEPYKAESEDKE